MDIFAFSVDVFAWSCHIDLHTFVFVFCFCFIPVLHMLYYCNTAGWTWWDWSLILEPYLPSVLWYCWLGLLTRTNPSPIWPIMCLVGRQTLLNQPLHTLLWRTFTSCVLWYFVEELWSFVLIGLQWSAMPRCSSERALMSYELLNSRPCHVWTCLSHILRLTVALLRYLWSLLLPYVHHMSYNVSQSVAKVQN